MRNARARTLAAFCSCAFVTASITAGVAYTTIYNTKNTNKSTIKIKSFFFEDWWNKIRDRTKYYYLAQRGKWRAGKVAARWLRSRRLAPVPPSPNRRRSCRRGGRAPTSARRNSHHSHLSAPTPSSSSPPLHSSPPPPPPPLKSADRENNFKLYWAIENIKMKRNTIYDEIISLEIVTVTPVNHATKTARAPATLAAALICRIVKHYCG